MGLAPPEGKVWGLGRQALLEGNKLVRLTYLDEAGISSSEPFAVVAGVIVHGDEQLGLVESGLQSIVEAVIPPPDQTDFVFSAKHLFSGAKYFKDREVWPASKRFEILELLADIPRKLSLPIVYGVSSKEWVRSIASGPDAHLDFVFHACAFANATQMTELFFRKHCPSEHTILICEDRPEVRKRIKRVHAMLLGKGHIKPPSEIYDKFFEVPYKHIKDAVHFTEKTESPFLQVADVCAFLIRGFLTEHPRSRQFFARLAGNLLDLNVLRESVKSS